MLGDRLQSRVVSVGGKYQGDLALLGLANLSALLAPGMDWWGAFVGGMFEGCSPLDVKGVIHHSWVEWQGTVQRWVYKDPRGCHWASGIKLVYLIMLLSIEWDRTPITCI